MARLLGSILVIIQLGWTLALDRRCLIRPQSSCSIVNMMTAKQKWHYDKGSGKCVNFRHCDFWDSFKMPSFGNRGAHNWMFKNPQHTRKNVFNTERDCQSACRMPEMVTSLPATLPYFNFFQKPFRFPTYPTLPTTTTSTHPPTAPVGEWQSFPSYPEAGYPLPSRQYRPWSRKSPLYLKYDKVTQGDCKHGKLIEEFVQLKSAEECARLCDQFYESYIHQCQAFTYVGDGSCQLREDCKADIRSSHQLMALTADQWSSPVYSPGYTYEVTSWKRRPDA